MTLIRITAPSTTPVSVAEAKANGAITHGDDDALIGAMIAAATAHVERACGIALESQTWELVLDAFPGGCIVVDLGPIVSVSSIKYLDGDGVEQTIPATDYVVDTASASGRISPADGWPQAQDVVNAVRVQFVVGNGAPDDLKTVILMLVQHWYLHRAASSVDAVSQIPLAVESLMNLHRRMFV